MDSISTNIHEGFFAEIQRTLLIVEEKLARPHISEIVLVDAESQLVAGIQQVADRIRLIFGNIVVHPQDDLEKINESFNAYSERNISFFNAEQAALCIQFETVLRECLASMQKILEEKSKAILYEREITVIPPSPNLDQLLTGVTSVNPIQYIGSQSSPRKRPKDIDLIETSIKDALASSLGKSSEGLKSLLTEKVLQLINCKASLKDHKRVFSVLPQLRYLYLEILENSREFETLKQLEMIPNRAGLRPFFRRKAEKLKEAVTAITTSHPSRWCSYKVRVEGRFMLDVRYLRREVMKQILDENGDIKRFYNHSIHRVSPLTFTDIEGKVYSLHFKQYPFHATMEFAIHNLMSRLAGFVTPSSTLVRFEVEIDRHVQRYPVLISETIPGITLKEALKGKIKVNPAQWTWMVLLAILTRPGDGLLSNYIIDDLGNIYCVDNDSSFVEPVMQDGPFGWKNCFLSALFCILPLDTLLDIEVLKEFCHLNIDNILEGWIKDVLEEQKYAKLFLGEELEYLSLDKENPTTATLHAQFLKLQNRVKKALAQGESLSASMLLKEIISLRNNYPVGEYVYKTYEKAIVESRSVEEMLQQIMSKTRTESLKSIIEGSLGKLEASFGILPVKDSLSRAILELTHVSHGKDSTGKASIQVDLESLQDDVPRQEYVLRGLILQILEMEERPALITIEHCSALNSQLLGLIIHENLEKIELRFCNKITDEDIELIQQKCPRLKQLILNTCTLLRSITTGRFFNPFLHFPSLELLSIDGCNFLETVKLRAPQMKILQISLAQPFYQARSLKEVDVAIPASAVVEIQNNRNFRKNFQINRRPLTNFDLSLLKGIPCTILDLSGCKEVSDAGLADFKDLPLLELDLTGCLLLTDAALKLLKRRPLRKLILEACPRIMGEGFESFRYLHLKELDISGNGQLKDAGITPLKFIILEALSLNQCDGLTDQALQFIKDIASLKILRLNSFKNLTNTGLSFLSVLSLERLSLKKCKKITDEGLSHLERMKTLQFLDVSGCCRLTEKGINSLKIAIPSITIYRD